MNVKRQKESQASLQIPWGERDPVGMERAVRRPVGHHGWRPKCQPWQRSGSREPGDLAERRLWGHQSLPNLVFPWEVHVLCLPDGWGHEREGSTHGPCRVTARSRPSPCTQNLESDAPPGAS